MAATKTQAEDPKETMARDLWQLMLKTSPTVMKRVISDIDAWTNYDANELAKEAGVSVAQFAPFVKVHVSNRAGGPKACIFDASGRIIDKVEAVNGLQLLYGICKLLGVDADNNMIGRGYQASELKKRLHAFIDRGPARDAD